MPATLAELRKQKGITQQELADAIKVSPSSIAMYETGERFPSYRVLNKLAVFFATTIDQIKFGR